ncbi:hypothetical protein [Pseudomonas phage D6]|nr:hypothetical protein [Pseudomonas phage D6]
MYRIDATTGITRLVEHMPTIQQLCERYREKLENDMEFDDHLTIEGNKFHIWYWGDEVLHIEMKNADDKTLFEIALIAKAY